MLSGVLRLRLQWSNLIGASQFSIGAYLVVGWRLDAYPRRHLTSAPDSTRRQLDDVPRHRIPRPEPPRRSSRLPQNRTSSRDQLVARYYVVFNDIVQTNHTTLQRFILNGISLQLGCGPQTVKEHHSNVQTERQRHRIRHRSPLERTRPRNTAHRVRQALQMMHCVAAITASSAHHESNISTLRTLERGP